MRYYSLRDGHVYYPIECSDYEPMDIPDPNEYDDDNEFYNDIEADIICPIIGLRDIFNIIYLKLRNSTWFS
jgi:hypothetical protein